jgi:transposase
MLEGHLVMSGKERERKSLFERVKRKEMRLVEASEVLGLSYRQSKRSYARFLCEGDKGLVHRNRGRASNRRIAADVKEGALAYYVERLEGFGPTLAAEKLVEHGLAVDHETLRRWLLEAGIWHKQRRRREHRSRRERRAHFGELVQMDGSPHHWFGPDGLEYTLLNMVDDATGRTMSLMATGETLDIVMRTLWQWIERYGIPKALYTDRKNIFKSDREPTLEEQLAGERPMTAFEKACTTLGIEIIRAHSPQAKGRVERNHAVYQDRFLKELRLRNITTLDDANRLLQGSFCDELNAKFAKPSREKADYHRRLPKGLRLEDVFVHEQHRRISNDWTLSFENTAYQIHADNRPLPKPKDTVVVRTNLEGTISILYRGKKLRFDRVNALPPIQPQPVLLPTPAGPKQKNKPVRPHSWRPNCARMLAELSYENKSL